MISTRKHGRVTVYFWPMEERGKTYLLRGQKTITQKVEYLFRHIKKHTAIPRAHLHLEQFKDGYAIFDREGCRFYYGRSRRTGRGIWERTPPVIKIENMHTVTDYDT